MRRYSTFLIVIALLLGGCSSSPPDRPADSKFFSRGELGEFLNTGEQPYQDDYYISIGDRLDVVFLRNTELSTIDLLVRSDGRISLHYVGDVIAAGRRPMELDSVLTSKFSEILREPDISVIVRASADELVYVLGEVKRPGGVQMRGPTSVVQMIAEAGGAMESSKLSRTVIIRRTGVSEIIGVEVNVDAILKGDAIHHDFVLRKNDIVYVPKKGINSLADFIKTVDNIVRPPFDMYLKGWQLANTIESYRYFRDKLED